MSQPRLLGEIMREYLLHSDDDYATAFRKLFAEHGEDLVKVLSPEEETDERDNT